MKDGNRIKRTPFGLKLKCVLSSKEGAVTQLAWSPSGHELAAATNKDAVVRWSLETCQKIGVLEHLGANLKAMTWLPDGRLTVATDNSLIRYDVSEARPAVRLLAETIEHYEENFYCMSWSPDGATLGLGTDSTAKFWRDEKRIWRIVLQYHNHSVWAVSWPPDGSLFTFGDSNGTINLIDPETGRQHLKLLHSGSVRCLAWSPDGQLLASGSTDRTIRIWNIRRSGQAVNILEAHTGTVKSLSFSADGSLLASTSEDNTLRLWACDTWSEIATLNEQSPKAANAAFHPYSPILATSGKTPEEIYIWEVDANTLVKHSISVPTEQYANAKVILVGDSGVGKSGLGLVISGHHFSPTDSTHGRHVWLMESQSVELANGRQETRETLLWDLAGQPGYRIIHQLHLTEIAVALVLFDSRSDTDPFAGVRHWDRALRQAKSLQSDSAPLLRKFLVAARVDRGSVGVSRGRINDLMNELSFDGYFETSAREGWQIESLKEAVRKGIEWESLPRVSSSNLFQKMKDFLIEEKQAERLLSTADDLYRAFINSDSSLSGTEELRQQFETCIGRLESRDLVQRLSFSNLVLLQPEMLDAYASAIVNAAKEEADGLGCISEELSREGHFKMSEDERIKNKDQEKLLLIATIEGLLKHELAIREHTENGTILVFPTQLTRENPDLPNPEGKAVVVTFEGPLMNIYATLIVRLSYSGIFKKKEMWKNATTFSAMSGGTCGIILNEIEEGRGDLILFFDAHTNEGTRFHFEQYVHTHLTRRALPGSVRRQRNFICPACSTPITELQSERRRERGFDWIECNVCGERVTLTDEKDQLTLSTVSMISEIDRAADARRTRETAASTLQGKIETGDFDVFLCHNARDKSEVRKIGVQLKEIGILPWLDEWELRPGLAWQQLLEKQIGRIRSAAVFVGVEGIGPWQSQELNAFLREFVSRGIPVIPVLLPTAPAEPNLPIFLKGMTWVDFRSQAPDPMGQLIWGVTGERMH